MGQLPKAMMAFFLLAAFLFVGMNVLSMVLFAYGAESYTSDAATILEAHDYAEDVATQLKEDAAAHGYTMEISVYDTDGDGHKDLAQVRTGYTLQVPLLGIEGGMHYARSYGR